MPQGLGVEPISDPNADIVHLYDQFAEGNVVLRKDFLALANLRGEDPPFFHFGKPFSPEARFFPKILVSRHFIREKMIHRVKIFAADAEKRLSFGGIFLIFQDVFDDGEGKEIIVLEFFDHRDAVNITPVVVGNVAAPLARFGQKALADIIMHGLFGHIRALHEVSNFHEIIPREESTLNAMVQTGVLTQVDRQGH
jgi:hypothetical protein